MLFRSTGDQQLLELKAKMGLLGPGGGSARQIGKGKDTVHEAEVVEDHDDGPGPTHG